MLCQIKVINWYKAEVWRLRWWIAWERIAIVNLDMEGKATARYKSRKHSYNEEEILERVSKQILAARK